MSDVNYTPEMVKAIEDAQPLNLEKAKALGETLGRSYRSIIAKAKSEGFEYVSAPAPAKKAKGPTKLEVVAMIQDNTGLNLEGLEKAPAAVLSRLLDYTQPEG